MSARAAVLLLAALPLAGCLAPSAPLGSAALPMPDPLGLGALPVARAEYDLGPLLVRDDGNGRAYPIPVRGNVHYPSEGEGPFPLVLFMHGRHGTCTGPAVVWVFASGPLVCPRAPPLMEPEDSYTGYDWLAEPLASHGYVVASLDANQVNARDGDTYITGLVHGVETDHGMRARAELVLHTLDAFARWNGEGGDAPGDAVRGRLDLGRVGLMGHSRGGEGVVRAVHLNLERPEAERHAIRAVLALAPSDFLGLTAPGVDFLTLLPYCDGDVWMQMGAWMYDDSRLLARDGGWKYQLVATGANHNFYNTVWWQDDSAFYESVAHDPHCGVEDGFYGVGAGRLDPETQRRQGLPYLAGFFRATLGGEAALRALLTGAAAPPAAACPAGRAACPETMLAAAMAPAADRLLLEDGAGDALRGNDLGGAARAQGFARAAVCTPAWASFFGAEGEPCEARRAHSTAPRLELAWDGPAWYALDLPSGTDARRFEALTLRAGVDAGSPLQPADAAPVLRVTLTDAAGRAATARVEAAVGPLAPPPGVGARQLLLSTLAVPLGAFAGVDLGDLRELRLAMEGRGALHLADLAFQRGLGGASAALGPAPLAWGPPPEPQVGVCGTWHRGVRLAGHATGLFADTCPLDAVPDHPGRARGAMVEAAWDAQPTVGSVTLAVRPAGCAAASCEVARVAGAAPPLRIEVPPEALAGQEPLEAWVGIEGGAAQWLQVPVWVSLFRGGPPPPGFTALRA